jgi:acetylornithine deacetylase
MMVNAKIFSTENALNWLSEIIRIPSFSKEEDLTAHWFYDLLEKQGAMPFRSGNNVWALSAGWDTNKPTLLLNSHHDTVKPVSGWTFSPFEATRTGDKIIGLGSNDAGASLICLLCTFLQLRTSEQLSVNLVFAATAEEEISGPEGISSILSLLPPIDMAIVGEPTQMQMAVAEKGLLVVDAVSKGMAGHAARNEGVNAIYEAMKDIALIHDFSFPKISTFLGPVNMSVTQIHAGTQHNVVPDRCSFVIDIRTNELYSNEEVFEMLRQTVKAELKARSFRLRSSGISLNHPLVLAGLRLHLTPFGSPTLSDQALMPFPSLKIGVGDSARSHTADEYINIQEIEQGLSLYYAMITGIQIAKN